MKNDKEKFKSVTILIDESGTLPDPRDKVIVIAAVGAYSLRDLQLITKKVRQKIRFKKIDQKSKEIKFYRSSRRTKTLFLSELIEQDIDLFVLVVDKDNQSIADTPENFALLCYFLIKESLLIYKDVIKEIIFDRHFLLPDDQKLFNHLLHKLLKKKFKIQHLDSAKNPEINVADMIAGSFLWYYTGKDQQFYQLIKEKVISEKILNWKQARVKFLRANKKASLNRRKRPSK